MKMLPYELRCFYDKEAKCWTTVEKHDIFNENSSAGEIAFFMLNNKNPADVMQISDSEATVLTYKEALTAAIRIAQHFDSLGLGHEDLISIFAPNTTYVMPVTLAALFNCTPFQPINIVMDTDDVKQIWAISKPKVIFCDGLHYEKLKKATEGLQTLIYTICNHLEQVPSIQDLLQPTASEQDYRPKSLTQGPSQTMVIMLSSGTTGLSKGICLSNRYCLSCFSFQYKNDIAFSTSSIDWLTGLLTLFINILRGGARVITHKPYSPEYLLELITKYKITILTTNPPNLLKLCQLETCSPEKLKSLRIALIGGAHCSESNLRQIRPMLAKDVLFFGYGSTELGGLAVNWRDYKLKSVGQLLANLQMKIIDLNTGERLGPNQQGELCFKKANDQWLGYYKNPKATHETLDSEGFVHTGDVGFMDEENFLYVTDRCQDVYKHLFFKWSPNEIEMVISEMPDVAEVCVFGVYDEIKLHVPAAAVVPKRGSNLSAADVAQYVQQRIEVHYKHLNAGVFILDQLPRNRNGKVIRQKTSEICLAQNKRQEN